MRERLEQLMELLHLSPTQFANEIGIQRTTLQHILNGRNEPSLKIIMAIHNKYPDVELEWLLNGIGSAIPHLDNTNNKESDYPLLPGMEGAFFPTDVRKTPDFSNLRGEETAPRQRKSRINKDVRAESSSTETGLNKAIKEVVVFFADGTYQKFSSDLKK